MRFWLVSLTIISMLFVATACSRTRTDDPQVPMATVVIDGTVEPDDSAMNASGSTESAPIGQGQGRPGTGRMGGMTRGNGGMMAGMGAQMRERHMAPIPPAYAGLTSPVASDVDSLARGKAHFDQFCASCHGNQGLGDGPAAAALDPAPPMLAQVSLMTGDDYLFWRISEGGALDPFNSAMPAWKEILDGQARWDIINYARSLGEKQGVAGGGAMREEMQATMQAEMLAPYRSSRETPSKANTKSAP